MASKRKTSDMKIADVAWIAGFWEGEGSAGCYHYKRGGWSLYVSIAQKDRSALDKIRKMLGYGVVTEQHAPLCPLSYKWCCSGAVKARKFLLLILPHIRGNYKHKQILKALKLDRKHVVADKLTNWTNSEIQILKKFLVERHRPLSLYKKLQRRFFPSRTVSAIKDKAQKLKLLRS